MIVNDTQSNLSKRTAQPELDEHARSIRKQLKSLRKETEFAKKLILNEKKIGHLLDVLDRSKETIYRQSVHAYEQNQSIITDKIQRSNNKQLQRDNSRLGI